jgi:hypothetical protein
MRHERAIGAWIFVVVVAACATGADDEPSNDPTDGGTAEGGGPCNLGTVQNCSACGVPCPGADDDRTRRACNNGACDVVCRGEHYDVDGNLENGCEAKEEPLQDSPTTAVAITLPNVPNDPAMMSNPRNVVAPLYQDTRAHEDAPMARPLGREDWYAVTAVGVGSPSATMGACLSAVNFPTDNELEVCITGDGGTSFDPGSCATVAGGGGSSCVRPPGTPDSGLFLVRVRKTKGSATRNGYALFLNH